MNVFHIIGSMFASALLIIQAFLNLIPHPILTTPDGIEKHGLIVQSNLIIQNNISETTEIASATQDRTLDRQNIVSQQSKESEQIINRESQTNKSDVGSLLAMSGPSQFFTQQNSQSQSPAIRQNNDSVVDHRSEEVESKNQIGEQKQGISPTTDLTIPKESLEAKENICTNCIPLSYEEIQRITYESLTPEQKVAQVIAQKVEDFYRYVPRLNCDAREDGLIRTLPNGPNYIALPPSCRNKEDSHSTVLYFAHSKGLPLDWLRAKNYMPYSDVDVDKMYDEFACITGIKEEAEGRVIYSDKTRINSCHTKYGGQ